MISHQIHVDWQVGEEVYDAETLGFPRQRMGLQRARTLIQGEMRLAQHLLRGVFLLILATFIGTSQTPSVNQREQLRVRDGIERTLALETLAWQRNYLPLAERILDENVDIGWQRERRSAWSIEREERSDLNVFLTSVTPLADYAHDTEELTAEITAEVTAEVTVEIDNSLNEWWISSPYRETRFYQQNGNEWKRTLPANDFWGEARALQSEHIHFDYQAADSESVETIAPQMDQVYVTLHQALGVEPQVEMLTVSIVPDLPQRGSLPAEYIEITSPILAKVPAALSNAEYLAHQVASHFTALAFEQAVAGHSNLHLSRWQRMTWALRGWLRTDALAQRTPWHQQADAIFRERLAEQWPLHLQNLNDWDGSEPASQEERMWQYASSESLLIYAVDAYGLEIIPALLDGFGRYPTWKEVVPTVFHIPADEFERDYNRYLTEQYALSSALFAE